MKTITLFILSFFYLSVYSQQWDWTKFSNSSNVYDTLVFNETKDTAVSSQNIFTVTNSGGYPFLSCFDISGNFLWKKIFNNAYPSDFSFGNIVADKNSNVYLSVQFYTSFTIDSLSFSNQYGWDILFMRFDQSGNLTWYEQIKGNDTEWVPKIGVDSSLNIYCGGDFQDSIYIGNYAFQSDGYCGQFSASCGDIFLCKYNSIGQVLWALKGGQLGSDYINDMKVSPEGNIYFCGLYRNDTIRFGNIALPFYNTDNYHQTYLIKIDTHGNSSWGINTKGNKCYSSPSSLLYYPNGIIYMSGGINSPMHDIGYTVFGTDTLYENDTLQMPSIKFFVSKITDFDMLSVSELSEIDLDIIIFPNPSLGIFTVDLRNCLAGAKVTVRDVLGNCLLEKNCRGENSQEINLSGQPRGIYFVELLSGTERRTEKIIIE